MDAISMAHLNGSCGHEWEYTPQGDETPNYCSCPSCRSTISVEKWRQDKEAA